MTTEQQLRELQRASDYVLRREGFKKIHAEISFVGPGEIRRLNRQYRKKDAITDVLSFREFDAHIPFPNDAVIGEIVLCRSYIRSQASEFGVAYAQELLRMTIHGTLHLLDYDHETKRDAAIMLPLQEKYIEHFL
ncbi:MAG: rRNA maturation RNase YbeY [Candidatus Magasanikbacteria bacterium RIFCSPHIGHO2_01_FULL_50_8]|uniref:Endoribonuclease YbeY n=2 Tax=Candidatus Magasanikiibacteriota TaxID=1752731 RepID=A0A1F6LQM8_9BACT|nr:MAG: rRNA maturation RNase YbeY [Candidatus Magasanikbacteria bacterium RIFCSPHIGHO2_01_FULL_50_8]OGH67973.1 MAG: rRNA maturation RNase YbeY [Candidatus Magasanikbacteria bacterium RIFCSPHIGHO2_02_FULL_50_9b]